MPRASVPALGAVLLVGVTVLLVVVLTVAVTGFAPSEPAEPVVLELSADSVTGEVTLVPVSGPPLDVRAVSLRVEIDGEELVHQPPVPFDGATGFFGAPSGPFNRGTDPAWTVGEAASFTLASTNDPPLTPGAELSVTVTRDGQLVARATTTVA